MRIGIAGMNFNAGTVRKGGENELIGFYTKLSEKQHEKLHKREVFHGHAKGEIYLPQTSNVYIENFSTLREKVTYITLYVPPEKRTAVQRLLMCIS